MRQRIALVVLPAAILAVTDVSVKLAYPTDERHFHPRSGTWVALSFLLLGGDRARPRAVAGCRRRGRDPLLRRRGEPRLGALE